MENTYFNKTHLSRETWKTLDGSGTITYSMKRIFQIKEYLFEVQDDSGLIEIMKNDSRIAVIASSGKDFWKDFFSDDKVMLEFAVAFIENDKRYGSLSPFQIGMSSDSGYLKIGDYFLTDCDPHFDEDYDDTEYGEIR